MRTPLYFQKLAWRESRNKPKLAIEIHGPRRDYDCAVFCCEHNTDAEQFAAAWSAELIDALEPGEEESIKFVVRYWCEADDSCGECDEDDNEGP